MRARIAFCLMMIVLLACTERINLPRADLQDDSGSHDAGPDGSSGADGAERDSSESLHADGPSMTEDGYPDATPDQSTDGPPAVDAGSDASTDAGRDAGPPCISTDTAERCETEGDDNCDGVSSCSTCSGEEIVVNGSCETDPAPEWVAVEYGSASGSLVRDCSTAALGSCSCRIAITTPGDGNDLELVQGGLAVPAGAHELCFSLTSSVPKPVTVSVEQDGVYTEIWAGTADDVWRSLCSRDVPTDNVYTVRFEVDDGTETSVHIDAVSLRSCP